MEVRTIIILFNTQTKIKIRLETEAKLHIQANVCDREYLCVGHSCSITRMNLMN